MSFPFGLGSGLGSGPSIMGMRRLLKRLLPSGYSESGALLEELECWAAMLFVAHTLPQRVASEAFVSIASELLEEWEREYGLPNDAARTPAERQSRLVAAERAIGGAIRSRVESVLREISATAEWRTTTQLDLFYDDLTTWPSMIRQHAVELGETEWAKPAVRRAIARVMQRMTGATGHFQHGFTDPAEAVVARTDAEWGSADHVIGRDAIRRGATSLDIARYEQVATLRRFGPLAKIRAADLNEIQDATVYRRVTDGVELDALTGVQADRIALSFAAECAVGPSTTVIDEGEDWRYRLATVWIAVASDDIRPGGASDAFVGTTAQARQIWYAGGGSTDAGAAANANAIELIADVYLYADQATGALKIRNESAGTRYAVGMIHATGPNNNHITHLDDQRLVTFVDGTTFADAGLDADFHASWKRAGWTRMGEGTVGVDAWASRAGDGGSFIVAVIPAVMPGDAVVIDSYRDWRDRLIAVTCTSIQLGSWTLTSTNPAWPGSSRFDQLQVHPDAADAETDQDHTSLAYTRLGNADGDTIAGTMCALEAEARVWVDSTTGILKLTRDADDAQTYPECYLLLIHATEQLGEHSTPDTLETLAVSDGDPIHPQELTQPQERSLCVQAVGYPGTAQAASSSLPLGPVAPPTRPTLPEMWESESGTRPFSQQVAGWARVYFSGVVPADSGELVLDATRDWRDRFLWASVAHSTTSAHTIGGGTPSGINAAGTTRLSAARYTGDGAASIWTDTGDNPYSLDIAGTGYGARIVSGDDSNVVTVYARESDGALCVASTRSGDLAVTAMVEATFQLGLRPSR